MEIHYSSRKVQKLFSEEKELNAKFGRLAKTIKLRLTQMEAAETLHQLHKDMPGLRIHEYQGREKGQLSIDLSGNYRLLFKPTDPPPLKKDTGLDWAQITSIVILEVTDPH